MTSLLAGLVRQIGAREPPARRCGEKVHLYLDVSGSVESLLGKLHATVRGVADLVWREVHLFSTDLVDVPIKDLARGGCQTTGGTSLLPVVRHIRENGVRRAVIVTDGEVGSLGARDEEVLRGTILGVALTNGRLKDGELARLARRVVVLPGLASRDRPGERVRRPAREPDAGGAYFTVARAGRGGRRRDREMSRPEQPMERREFAAQRLFEEHPPVLRNPNKKAVQEIACPPGSSHGGRVVITRWAAMPLPGSLDPGRAVAHVVRHDGFYDYRPVLAAAGAIEWHVNFADPHLFVAYGSPLFAQDEIQAAEHPILGSVREALQADGASTLTVEAGRPTPILVAGAERRCHVATNPSRAEGRPRGLYGNEFGQAPAEAVRRATTRIEPATTTNLVAMAAPSGGYGPYSGEEIHFVLTTAWTGFRAAVLESGNGPVAIHTGFWGCGAFGGNRILMSMLQAIAAGAAGVDRLVFHASGEAGAAALDAALRTIRESLAGAPMSGAELVRRIAAMGFEWGESDGN